MLTLLSVYSIRQGLRYIVWHFPFESESSLSSVFILNLAMKINHCKIPCCEASLPMLRPPSLSWDDRQVLECEGWALTPELCSSLHGHLLHKYNLGPASDSRTFLCSYLVFAPPYPCKHHFLCALLFYFRLLPILSVCVFYQKNVSSQVWLKTFKTLLKDFSLYGRQVGVRGGVYVYVVKIMVFLENGDWLIVGHWCPGFHVYLCIDSEQV